MEESNPVVASFTVPSSTKAIVSGAVNGAAIATLDVPESTLVLQDEAMFGLKNNEQIYLRGYSDGFNNNHLKSTPRFIGPAFNLISDSEAATVVKEFEISDTFESTDSYNVGFNDLTFVEDIKTKLNIVYNSIDGKTVNIDLSKNLISERTGLFDDGFMIISFKHNGKNYEFDYRNEMGYPVTTGSVLDEKIGVVKNPTEWNNYGVDKEEIISTYYGKTLELSGTINVNPEKVWKNKEFTFENVSDESYSINFNLLMNDSVHRTFNINCNLDDASGLSYFMPYDGINNWNFTINFIGITEDYLSKKNLLETVNNMKTYPGIKVNFLPSEVIPPEAEDASLNWTYSVDDTDNSITLKSYIGDSDDVTVKNNYSVDGKIYDKVRFNSGPWLTDKPFNAKKNTITSIKIEDGVEAPSDMSYFLSGLKNLTYLDINGLNTSNVTDLKYFMYNTPSIKYINLSDWDVSKVTSMENLVNGASSLECADFMFDNTSNLNKLSGFINNCPNLEYVNFGNLNSVNVETSSLSQVSKLKYIYVSDADSKVNMMTALGLKDSSSIKVAIGKPEDFIIPQEIIDNWTYTDDASTRTLTLESYIGNDDEINIKNRYSGYDNIFIDAGYSDSSSRPFDNVKSTLKSISLDDGVKITGYMNNMFKAFTSLENVDISNVILYEIDSATNLFRDCTNLKSVKASNLDFSSSSLDNVNDLFNNCSSLYDIDISGWDTSSFTQLWNLYKGCSSLKKIDMSDWDLTSVTISLNVFEGTSDITIYVKDEDAKSKIESDSSLPSTAQVIIGKPE